MADDEDDCCWWVQDIQDEFKRSLETPEIPKFGAQASAVRLRSREQAVLNSFIHQLLYDNSKPQIIPVYKLARADHLVQSSAAVALLPPSRYSYIQ